MFIDYLDPFWPVRSPEPPVDRSNESRDSDEERPVREERPVDSSHEERPEEYDNRGDVIDEYA